MTTPVERLEAIGEADGARLREHGCATAEDLLNQGATRTSRRRLSAATGIADAVLLTGVRTADLLRIDGVGLAFASLLQAAGVDTVRDLRRRNGASLAERLATVNNERQLVRKSPARATVEKWISQAGELPPLVE